MMKFGPKGNILSQVEAGDIKDGVLVVPESVTVIEKKSCKGNSSLESVIFPSTLKVIDQQAFSGCIRLKCIMLHKRPVFISSLAFDNCVSLTQVIIHKESDISKGTLSSFQGCPNVKSILVPDAEDFYIEHIKEMMPPWLKKCVSSVSGDVIKATEKARQEVITQIISGMRSKYFSSSKLPSVFLPSELVGGKVREYGGLKEYEKKLEAILQIIPIPDNIESIGIYKSALQQKAFLFHLKNIYYGVWRLSEFDTLNSEIKRDVRKKVHVISKLYYQVIGAPRSEDMTSKEANFLLHEGKGRIKRLLEEFMPKIKKELEVLASSEEPQEASASAAAATPTP